MKNASKKKKVARKKCLRVLGREVPAHLAVAGRNWRRSQCFKMHPNSTALYITTGHATPTCFHTVLSDQLGFTATFSKSHLWPGSAWCWVGYSVGRTPKWVTDPKRSIIPRVPASPVGSGNDWHMVGR